MNKISIRKKSILPFINKKKFIKMNSNLSSVIEKELLDAGNEIFDNKGNLVLKLSMQKEPADRVHTRYAVDATVDTIVDFPFTETYDSDYKVNRREDRKLRLDF